MSKPVSMNRLAQRAKPILLRLCGLLIVLNILEAKSSAIEEPTSSISIDSASRVVNPDGVPGILVLAGGGEMPPVFYRRFFTLAQGEKGRLVIVPTASAAADELSEENLEERGEAWLSAWRDLPFERLDLLHINHEAPNDAELELLRSATAIWFDGGDQSRLSERMIGTAWESEIVAIAQRGGVIGGTSAGAAIQSRIMITGGAEVPEIGTGLDLVPGAIVDQHFSQRNRLPRLRAAVAQHPGSFGIGIDEGSSVIVRGRLIRVSGEGQATLVLAAGKHRPAREIVLDGGSDREAAADLVAVQRMAINRADQDFPWTGVGKPEVNHGTLVIVGGGGTPGEAIAEFMSAAGANRARIVVLPTAEPPPLEPGPPNDAMAELFLRAGAAEVTILPQYTLEAVSSPEFLAAIDQATGVWFGGGRQWRFVDAYENTPAVNAFRRVLERGGVIGGSSAGATIQGEYLARGNPLGNTDIMSEGYERGLSFLPGVGIDQHFSQRNRLTDLQSLVLTYPQVLGIGIDESTALVVKGSIGKVVGRGTVTLLAAPPEDAAGDSAVESELKVDQLVTEVLQVNEQFDLIQRRRVDSDESVMSEEDQ